jgi:uncharacterized protein (DUF302 family)
MASGTDRGIIDRRSRHSVDETVDALRAILHARDITLFAIIDHSGEAAKAGMRMAPTKLLIFGNPKGGTPVMLAAPSAAIDLPLKILVWENTSGTVFVSYNAPEYLRMRHGFPASLLSNIGVVEALVGEVAQ